MREWTAREETRVKISVSSPKTDRMACQRKRQECAPALRQAASARSPRWSRRASVCSLPPSCCAPRRRWSPLRPRPNHGRAPYPPARCTTSASQRTRRRPSGGRGGPGRGRRRRCCRRSRTGPVEGVGGGRKQKPKLVRKGRPPEPCWRAPEFKHPPPPQGIKMPSRPWRPRWLTSLAVPRLPRWLWARINGLCCCCC